MTVRLYVDHPLDQSQPVELSRDQSHYLIVVMRLSAGTEIEVFNNADGAFHATIEVAHKRATVLRLTQDLGPSFLPPDVWLCFAPIKKARTDFIVEKAAELGVRRILPVTTRYTNSDRIRQDRLQAHAREAAEQCEATFVPEVAELQPLSRLLDHWPQDRRLFFCDETLANGGAPAALQGPGPWAILIGPEGGFSDDERKHLAALTHVQPIALGPRILRADTAAVAALTLFQHTLGDWRGH